MARLAVLLLFVAAFAPAAVMGALPLVLLTVVTVTAMLAALVLALPQHEPAVLPTEVDDSESKSIQIIRPRTVVEKLLSAEEAGAEIIGVATSPEQSLYSTLPTLQRELPRNGRAADKPPEPR